MIIAIDGPSASGKGTLARRLADHFHCAYLDTGLLYRALGYRCQQNISNLLDAPIEAILEQANTLTMDDLSDQDFLRTEDIGRLASHVASLPQVRPILDDFQRFFAHHPPRNRKGTVLDGRDIGSVICPDADIKFYITADATIRAQRRHKDLALYDTTITLERVLQDLKDRDDRDINRTTAPLTCPSDAHIIDNGLLTKNEAFDHLKSLVLQHVPAAAAL